MADTPIQIKTIQERTASILEMLSPLISQRMLTEGKMAEIKKQDITETTIDCLTDLLKIKRDLESEMRTILWLPLNQKIKFENLDAQGLRLVKYLSPYERAVEDPENPKVAAIEMGDKIELYFNHNDTVYRMSLVKESWIEFIEKYPNFRNEREILQMEENAFSAGREKDVYPSMVDGSEMYKYWKFSDYKSHNQTTK